MEGGPIAVMRDGDRIVVDIRNRRISMKLSDEELNKRISAWSPPSPKVTSGYLYRYSRRVSSASEGAVLK
jgi:dihydroxy-acid dehydratase